MEMLGLLTLSQSVPCCTSFLGPVLYLRNGRSFLSPPPHPPPHTEHNTHIMTFPKTFSLLKKQRPTPAHYNIAF
ncbi:hypothetical protein BGS_1426 [Beggiatoa sp. SS]|nr:hypothetical protein BGS_1426 [Beggiatoa sp. SS]